MSVMTFFSCEDFFGNAPCQSYDLPIFGKILLKFNFRDRYEPMENGDNPQYIIKFIHGKLNTDFSGSWIWIIWERFQYFRGYRFYREYQGESYYSTVLV